MSDSRRDEITPIPEVEQRRIDEELRDFLAHKRQERTRGFTNENLYKTMLGISRTVQEHGKELKNHSADIRDLQEWRDEHMQLHRRSERPLPIGSQSLPPPRGQMDTGKYEIHLSDLQRAIEITKAEFTAYKQGQLVEENHEMKKKIDWWWKWAVGIISSLVAAALGWLAAKAGLSK